MIAIISMFRNKESIAPFWAQQVVALADFSVLIDHRSEDRSSELLATIPESAILKCDSSGYPQSAIMSAAMQECFRLGAEWVIPLDLDEFIPFSTRNQLSAFLDLFSEHRTLRWPWRNLCPEEMEHEFTLDQKFTYLHAAGNHWKVIINRKAYERDPHLTLSPGSHELNAETDVFPISDTPLRHIPVRSRNDWFAKTQQGTTAVSEDPKFQQAGYGIHWAEHALRGTEVSGRELNQTAWCYPLVDCKKFHLWARKEEFQFLYPTLNRELTVSVLPSSVGTITVKGDLAEISWGEK